MMIASRAATACDVERARVLARWGSLIGEAIREYRSGHPHDRRTDSELAHDYMN
jgi:hypothetical protein